MSFWSKKKDKKDKQNPGQVMKNIWFMLRFTWKCDPGLVCLNLTEAVTRAFSAVIRVLYYKYLFDAIETAKPFSTILVWVLIYIGFEALLELFYKWFGEVYLSKARLTLHEGMQKTLYEKARSLDQSCYDDPAFYNDFIWAIRLSDDKAIGVVRDISFLLKHILTTVGVLGVLLTLDPIVAAFLGLLLILGFFVKNKQERIHLALKDEVNPIGRRTDYVGRVFYLQDYAKELRQGGIAEHLKEDYQKSTKEKIACIKKYSIKILGFRLLVELLTDIFPFAGLTVYMIIRYVLDPTLSLGSFAASINAGTNIYWRVNSIVRYLNKFNEHSLYINKLQKFLDYEPKIVGEVTDVPPFATLTIRDLDFAYPFDQEERKVLSGVNLEIKKGEKVAFVGYNGAGKTTLTKLLMRLYDPAAGEILYNGQSITDFAPESYRQHIGAVFQDYKVFAATLAENVMGGEYTDEDEATVLAALRAASFDEKLSELPKGIHSQLTTEYSSDGVGLSGGEAQKVAISRVFARPFEIIIMDEPSSALDPIAEYDLNQSILQYTEGKTVIFISHRLSTTRMADRIYMFDGGALVEQGSHEELMEQNGKYAEMYRVQAKKYKEGQA